MVVVMCYLLLPMRLPLFKRVAQWVIFIYVSFLFLLEVNDGVAMRPPAEPIIGTRLFLNLPSATFAALFPAPNVFVSFDLINHC